MHPQHILDALHESAAFRRAYALTWPYLPDDRPATPADVALAWQRAIELGDTTPEERDSLTPALAALNERLAP